MLAFAGADKKETDVSDISVCWTCNRQNLLILVQPQVCETVEESCRKEGTETRRCTVSFKLVLWSLAHSHTKKLNDFHVNDSLAWPVRGWEEWWEWKQHDMFLPYRNPEEGFNTGGCQAHFHIDIKSKINHLALFPFKENSKNLVAVQISKKLSLKRAAARLWVAEGIVQAGAVCSFHSPANSC